MSDRSGCEEVRALAPELALRIAPGDESARALGHLAACPECRRHLDELSALADELLLVVPGREPPPEFESRVLSRMHVDREPARRPGRPLVALAAALAAAIVTAVGFWLVVRDDLDVADRYQETLAVANGQYLSAAQLSAPDGSRAGTAFGYEGEPSWVLVTVYGSRRLEPGRYTVEVSTDSGYHHRLGAVRVRREGGAGGSAIPMPFHDVTEVRVSGPGRADTLRAEF